MSWLAPGYLVAAGAVAAAVALLHLLAWRRPPALALPTARFVPDRPARAVARALRPSDLLLLALRVAIVLLVGAAFAGPVRRPERRPVARVVAADVSRAVRSRADVADSARRWLAAGDALVRFDSAARAADTSTLTTDGGAPTRARGSLSAALLAALREGRRLASSADSLELVLVSPVAAEELDEATRAVRALWPGRVRLVRVAPAAAGDSADAGGPAAIEVVGAGAGDDPVAAAASLLGAPRGRPVRIARRVPNGADSAWLAAAPGRVLVVWAGTQAPGAGWTALAPPDTVGAVVAGDADGGGRSVLVAALPRAWRAPAAPGAVVARWVDGTPAAIERQLGEGCVREVAVAVPAVGDVALGVGFRRLLLALAEPCGGRARLTPVPDAELAWLISPATGPAGARPAFSAERASRSPISPWLLGLALLLAGLVEPLVRRRTPAAERGVTGGAAAADSSVPPGQAAA